MVIQLSTFNSLSENMYTTMPYNIKLKMVFFNTHFLLWLVLLPHYSPHFPPFSAILLSLHWMLV